MDEGQEAKVQDSLASNQFEYSSLFLYILII